MRCASTDARAKARARANANRVEWILRTGGPIRLYSLRWEFFAAASIRERIAFALGIPEPQPATESGPFVADNVSVRRDYSTFCPICLSRDQRQFYSLDGFACEACATVVQTCWGCIGCTRVVCGDCVCCEDGITLEECGVLFGVTRETIRKIEATALRKLRHPSRSHHLRPFIENEITPGERRQIATCNEADS